ncbi:lactonase family protein [Maribacter chungangensis]|uniref:Lactonase family protein n=1 Tax=Maribacter chungangensis TaxID=1069117 RepID=A0ABW3B854_9FLAO
MNTLYDLFVGTYTDTDSEGIYRYTFNSETGELTEKALAAATPNPSFIKIAPDKNYLYAVNETDTVNGNSGAVTAFKINGKQLAPLNTVSSYGAHPCHIGISKDGGMVAISNYSGGTISVFKTDAHGNLIIPEVIDHTRLDSTKTSHAHSALFLNDKLFVADLGLDRITAYPFLDGGIDATRIEVLQLPEKAGPRHFVFSDNAMFLYVINELNSTITVYQNTEDGSYHLLETKSTVADDFKGDSYCADVRLSPDGKFLYGSNRGENTIVVFAVDQTSGKLSLIEREDVRGDWPRNFNIDPSGNFLLVANQRSNNITVYKRDKENGGLTFTHEIVLPSPVCLEFLH